MLLMQRPPQKMSTSEDPTKDALVVPAPSPESAPESPPESAPESTPESAPESTPESPPITIDAFAKAVNKANAHWTRMDAYLQRFLMRRLRTLETNEWEQGRPALLHVMTMVKDMDRLGGTIHQAVRMSMKMILATVRQRQAHKDVCKTLYNMQHKVHNGLVAENRRRASKPSLQTMLLADKYRNVANEPTSSSTHQSAIHQILIHLRHRHGFHKKCMERLQEALALQRIFAVDLLPLDAGTSVL
jgi:hypothetical protein